MLIYNSNNRLQVTHLNFKDDKLNGNVKIIHISDLHQKSFGRDNSVLLNRMKNEKPDLIFVTGDLVSFSDENMKILDDDSEERYYHNLQYVIDVLKDFVKISPVYFSLGNHEKVFEKFDLCMENFKRVVENLGVVLLINEIDVANIRGSQINILGVENSYYQDIKVNDLIKQFQKKQGLKIILDHYPTNFALNGKFSYANYDVDYVFSGHEHGGQVRLPFVGGLVSHEEGFFPRYSEGVHTKNGTTLIISRGLGNSSVPIRLFNRPQLIVVDIN